MPYSVLVASHLILAVMYLGLWRWPAGPSNRIRLRLFRIGGSAICGFAVTLSFVSAESIAWGPLLGLAVYYIAVSVYFGRYRRYVKDIIAVSNGQACLISGTVWVRPGQQWFYYPDPSFAVVLNHGEDFVVPDVRAVHLWIQFSRPAIARIYENSGQINYALPSGSTIALDKEHERIMRARARAALKQNNRAAGFASGNFQAIHEATSALTKVLEDIFGFQVEFRITDIVEKRYSVDEEPEPDDNLYESAEAKKY